MPCNSVSIELKASRFAKFGNINPNNAMKMKKDPFAKQNGFQNFSLLQPNFMTIVPRRT